MKPTVRYDKNKEYSILPGHSAWVWPLDHPSDLVSNERIAMTSRVIKVNEDLSFETLNTLYVPSEA